MVKKKRKPKPLNEPKGRADHGTNESMSQAEGLKFETVDGGRAGAMKRVYVSQQVPMDRYAQRGLINDRQKRAAHALFVLYDQTRQAGRLTADYTKLRVDGGAGSGVNDYALADFFKLQKAIGQEAASVTRAVVIECESASNWAKRFRLPKRMGIEKLRLALDKLADMLRIY